MMILVAIALAFVITLSEIRANYERKPLKHIVNRYMLLYMLINGSIAAIVYLILPGVASFLLSDKIAQAVQSDSWTRVFIAGVGYALVLRSKLTDIKIGEHEIPAGFDFIYQAWSKPLLLHIGWTIDEKEREAVDRIYQDFPSIDIYLEELNWIIHQEKDADAKNRLSSKI